MLAAAALLVYWFLAVRTDQAGSYSWDFSVVTQNWGFLLQGLELTVELAVVSIALGLVLGILVALARLSTFTPLRVLIIFYIESMRCTPPLVQLVWVYYALPIVAGIQLPAFAAVVVALTLNLGAYAGEAFRSGIQAIPREELETAEVLGLTYPQRMRYVIVPQAFRIVLPVLISLGVSLFKDTSLVSTLGVGELLYQARSLASTTFRPLEILTTVAVMYFVIAFPATLLLRRLEIRLSRHRRR